MIQTSQTLKRFTSSVCTRSKLCLFKVADETQGFLPEIGSAELSLC